MVVWLVGCLLIRPGIGAVPDIMLVALLFSGMEPPQSTFPPDLPLQKILLAS